MNCPKCDAWVRRKEEIEDHKAAVCPTTTVPCILKCGRQFKRKDLKERMEHLLRCKLWVVHCPVEHTLTPSSKRNPALFCTRL
eukprot:684158-Amorphochlora_amoeboformis.AAC.1